MHALTPSRLVHTGHGGDAAAIEIAGLVKRYGTTVAVDGVSFTVRAGELFGLLGTNGAGKTTIVEILQGLRSRDSGHVQVLGLDPAVHGDRLRRLVGSQLQAAALPARMRVGEALRFFAGLHPGPRPLAELAEEWQLAALQRRSFEALSGGERQRLFVALALIGRPRVVFLDELTQNLDPVGRRSTWDVIRRIRDSGTTVVLVTHDVEEADRLCDRVVIMRRGTVVAEGAPQAIAAAGAATTVTFTDKELDIIPLRRLPGVVAATRNGGLVTVEGHGPVLAHVGAHLVAAGRPAGDLHAHRPTLEDRFVALTQEHPT